MKRRVVVIIAMLVTLLTISAEAVGLRAIGGMPRLTFNGTTAHCVVVCNGDKNTDEVKATLTLYQGSTYVDSWSASGKGKAYISEDCAVKSGKSYYEKHSQSICNRDDFDYVLEPFLACCCNRFMCSYSGHQAGRGFVD